MENKGKRKEPSSSSSSDPDPNLKQQLVLHETKSGRNLHIHGSAGVGKSWILKFIRSQLNDTIIPLHIKRHLADVLNMMPTAVVYYIICGYLEIDVARYVMVMSPTGMSSMNIRARTVHNAYRAVPETFDSDEAWAKHLERLVNQANEYNDLLDEFNRDSQNAALAMRLIRCETNPGVELYLARYIIFDEYPMIAAHIFDRCEEGRRLCSRSPKKVWGGAQVFTMGDPLQLQVIPSRWRTEHGLSTDPCWKADAWKASDFVDIELTEAMRQSEADYIEMLQRMRELPKGHRDPRLMEILKRRYFTEDQVEHIIRLNRDLDPSFQAPTRLYPRKVDVERVNLDELNKLTTPYHEYHAQVYYVREYTYRVPVSATETKTVTYKMSQRILTDRERECTWRASRFEPTVNRQGYHYITASVDVLRDIESMIHNQLLPSNFPVPVTAPVKEGAQMVVVRNVDLKAGIGNGTPCFVKGYADSKLRSENERKWTPAPGRFFHDDEKGAPITMPATKSVRTRYETAQTVRLVLTPHTTVLAPQDVIIDYNDATSLVAKQRSCTLNYTPWRMDLPVSPDTHENRRDYWGSDEYIEIWQMPLIPGYALSFHRSQSLTLPNGVILNGADCFGGGMFYMGCSRPTSFNRLYIISCDERRIYADPQALKFVQKCRGLTNENEEESENNGLFASSSSSSSTDVFF